jgi:hypothetical protein
VARREGLELGWLADFERLGLVTERAGEWYLRPDPHTGAGRGYCS